MPAFRHRVSVQAESLTPDGAGGFLPVWVDQFSLWARIEADARAEIVRADQLTPGTRYRVTVRHRSDIPSPARLKVAGQALRVLAHADPTGAREFTVIEAVFDGEAA